MIRGVLFDYGGVVADGGRGIDLAKRIQALLNLPDSSVDNLIFPLFGQLTRGKIDVSTFWQAIESGAQITIPDEQRRTWDDWWSFEPYPEMLELIETLKATGHQVGLLSNIIPPTRDRIAQAGGYDSFQFAILSCDVGYAKPDPEMYDLAMKHFKDLQSEEIVFIDDQEKCLPPAQDLGMETILASSSEQIIRDLHKLDLPV